MKVRIKTQASSPRRIKVTGIPGKNSSYGNQAVPSWNPDDSSSESLDVRKSLGSVEKGTGNIEAEGGESILYPDKGGLPAKFSITGPRHSSGGVEMNVPKDSFVFSDTKKMRIKDPEILAEFGKAKGSYTPADLAKKYDINKFRKQLQDPDSDPIMISTAEKMIGNYNAKLGKLALVQESKKGFPQGIPAVAMPYMSQFNVKPDQILPLKSPKDQESPQEDQQEGQEEPQMQYGGPMSVQTSSQTPMPPWNPNNPYYYEGHQSPYVFGPNPGYTSSDSHVPGYEWSSYTVPEAPVDWFNIPAKSDSVKKSSPKDTTKTKEKSVDDYMKEFGVDKATAIELKKAE